MGGPDNAEEESSVAVALKKVGYVLERTMVWQGIYVERYIRKSSMHTIEIWRPAENPYQTSVHVHATPNQFAFRVDPDKISGFMAWLAEEEDAGLLDLVHGEGGMEFIVAASKQATNRAMIEVDKARAARGLGAWSPTGMPSAVGALARAGQVNAVLNSPIPKRTVEMLYTRAYNELKGVTDAMDQGISRVLAEGLSQGLGPMQIARNMVKQVEDIGIKRARVIARTETIRAFHEQSINTYQAAGAVGVEVEAEFLATKDDKVCPVCDELSGKVFTLEEARGMIPVHPNCRCTTVPKLDLAKELFAPDVWQEQEATGEEG
jgi:SPP1 gp7 family putative phage head morphogenesis protein